MTLDEAWHEVETVLPDGWVIDSLRRLYGAGFKTDAWIARVFYESPRAGPVETGVGPSPDAALLVLRDKLVARRFPKSVNAAR